VDAILFWNQVSIDANKTDFTTERPDLDPDPQQGGPTRTSRALAIVHLAMYDAYAGILDPTKKYLTYSPTEVPGTVNADAARAAVASAACVTLIDLYSRQQEAILKKHIEFVSTLSATNDPEIELGLAWGRLVGAKMLNERKSDGSELSNALYAPSAEPGKHRTDPLNSGQKFLGPLWGRVKPFGIANLTALPTTPPPPLTDPKYTTDYNQVIKKGALNGSTRTPEEITQGLFWAYDGARNIGVPPRLYNQAIRAIALKVNSSEAANARLFAIVNVAMADAGIQAWHEKYLYNVWRPVVGVREADQGWGPTGKGDGNDATIGDPFWLPLGSPRTNQPGHNSFTPNFPAYPSGHATFGAAAFRAAELELNLPEYFKFSFVSDELNGESIDRDGSVRSRYSHELTIATAIEENLLSRVYLGVHWKFDGTEGRDNGKKIADRIQSSFPAKATLP